MDSIKYLDTIGINSLFSVAKGRDRLVLLCLYDLGCRVGELVTTRISDIDFHNGFIRIQSSRTKTRHFRAARVSQGTLQAIQESLQPGQKWLFPGRCNGHLSTKTVLRTIDRLAEEAGIQEVSPRQKLLRRKVTPHILRHSHVVNALMAGVPVPMIQKQAGHKRLSTTEILSLIHI
ncbi:MAG: site-specific integrase [Methanotrichaceae archaeon]|nr:site-specific integrase [Methanotrichaceae archaeon]